MTVRRSQWGTEWQQVHPGLYTWSDRTITRIGSRWELEGMVIDTSRHRSLRKAMDHSDQL